MVEAQNNEVTLFRALQLAARHVTAGVERHVQQSAGVSLSEFDVLKVLMTAPAQSARPGEIGEALAWEKSRISHQITRMRRRGLVDRRDCDADMRGTWVVLTAGGARAAVAAEAAYVAAIRAQLAPDNSGAEHQALARQLLELGKAASPGACLTEFTALEQLLEP